MNTPNIYSNNKVLFNSIGLSILVLTIIFLFHLFILNIKIYPMTQNYNTYMNDVIKINNAIIKYHTPNSIISVQNKEYLHNKFRILSILKYQHYELGRTYYANFYAISMDLIVLFSILSIILLTTANNGLKNSSIYLRVTFYTILGATAFLSTITISFSHKENYTNNFNQLIYYDNMQNDIVAFIKTSDTIDSTKSEQIVDSFINKLNNNFSRNNSLYLDIDESKINLDKINKTMELK